MARQARSAKTRERLVRTLETLLRSRDFDLIPVSEIAAEAGVAVGTVYTHFRNKEAFMEALLDEREARIGARLALVDQDRSREVLSALGSLRAAVELVVESSFEQVRADAPLIRATHHYAALHGGERSARWRSLRQQGQGGLDILFDLYGEEIRRPDRSAARRFFVQALESYYLSYALAEGNERGESLPADVEKRELSAMLYAYLTLPAAGE